MSACISRDGEFSTHLLDDEGEHRFVCRRCFALDEDDIFDAIALAEFRLARAEMLVAEWEAHRSDFTSQESAAIRLRDALESEPPEVTA